MYTPIGKKTKSLRTEELLYTLIFFIEEKFTCKKGNILNELSDED